MKALATIGVAFLALPILGLVLQLRWDRIGDLVSDPLLVTALRTTLVVVPAATLIVIVIGTPLAWLLARTDGATRTLLRVLVLSPVVLPPVVSGVLLLSAFGRRGLLGSALDTVGIVLPFSIAGAILAAAFVSLPFHVLAAEEGFRSIPHSQLDAARLLGVPEARILRDYAFPAATRAIAAGGTLAAARALGEFGATITFAGNVEGATRTLPLATFTALERDPDLARLIGVVLIGLAVLVAAAQRRGIRTRQTLR